ncbi:MAG: insulinase family protein [candidate division Zixibacteria bacterium]|nr:insulinase family protein [candidate division Zixibacteria bacterium]
MRSGRKAIGIVVLALSLLGQAAAFDLNVDVSQLENGLTVLICPDTTSPTASVFTFVNAGSRDEDRAGITGLAHVFEHMMFRGTPKYPSFVNAVTPLGAENNAWTETDYTAYFLNAEARFLEQMLEIESDRIQNLNFTNETFRTELGPVKEERRRGVADDAEGFLSVEHDRLAYTTHTYQHPVIGWEEDLEKYMTYEDGLQFKNRFYAPNNCVLVVTGNVDVGKTKELVNRFYAGWPRGEAYVPNILPEPRQTEERSMAFTWKDDETPPLLRIGYHIGSARDNLEDLAAMNLINQVLFGQSGRLTKRLRDELALVESVWGNADMRKDPSLTAISARLRRGASLNEVRDTIYGQLQRLTTELIPAAELDRARNNLRSEMIYRLDRPSRIAGSLGSYQLLAGNFRKMFELYDLYGSVTAEKIRSVALTVFAPTNRSVVTLVPKSGV